MPSIHQPRRPRSSPLWQIVHHGWADFLSDYEKHQRKSHGPLDPAAVSVVRSFLRCGDLAQGFTRLQCPDCGHEKLVAFTCRTRNFCPSCHQRRALSTGDWIAHHVCREVPRRQFVFTMPRMLRGIFRKRRKLLTILFHTATETLRDAFRARLDLPDGRIAAVAAIHSFQEKIHWNESTKTVIYRSRKHWRTKRNFEIFQATGLTLASLVPALWAGCLPSVGSSPPPSSTSRQRGSRPSATIP